jgi:hypothetical protein
VIWSVGKVGDGTKPFTDAPIGQQRQDRVLESRDNRVGPRLSPV